MSMDLQRLIDFDYLVVHSGDVGGPRSLHAPLPLRAGELLVRRGNVEAGIKLMRSKGLVTQIVNNTGFSYLASDSANPFVEGFTTSYLKQLKERAQWLVQLYGEYTQEELSRVTSQFYDRWLPEFDSHDGSVSG